MEIIDKKSKRTEEEIIKNLLTGLLIPQGFMEEARLFFSEMEAGAWCMVSIDILHFRLFNKFHGRSKGDQFLRYVADCLEIVRGEHGGVTGYFEGDNYALIMPWRMELVERLWEEIMYGVSGHDRALGIIPVFGISVIDDPGQEPEVFHDQATLARSCSTEREHITCYNPGMESYLEEEMCLMAEITEALDRDEFTFYAQPQCDIMTGKVVGAEALVRWNHPVKGLVPPGKFIPVLERSSMIHLLDMKVWEQVCRWLRSWIDRGYQPVPISINISRIDIMSMDVAAYLKQLLRKYDLPAKYIKAEVTESAYAEEDAVINNTVDQLRDTGMLVMMDDFGSGYSSLNMLKSIPVDVIKIDMRFLEIGVGEEQKGIGILESIVNMARLMGLPIIVEGVETLQQENVLRSMGCRYMQGYYYYKPLSIDQLERALADERHLDFTGLHGKQVEAFHVRELMDGNMFTDTMVNSILGASAIYDVYHNQVEIVRINEQGYRLAGLDVSNTKELSKRVWNNVLDDDKSVLQGLFEQAYERRPDGAEGNIHYLRVDGRMLWVRVKMFFLQEKNEHRMYFASLSDITALLEHRRENARSQPTLPLFEGREFQQLEQFYGTLPCGFGLSKIVLNDNGDPVDYDIIYINREMERMCGDDIKRLRHLINKAFGNNIEMLLEKAYHAALLGEELKHYAYSSVTGHYLQLTLFQYEYGYAGCLLRDITDLQAYEGAFGGMVRAFKEVYYLQLQENYCRMLYPDENLLQERGNYESMVESHFAVGRIIGHNEKDVRKFLSLDNLRKELETQDLVEFRYRRSSEGNPDEWCETSVSVSERENGKPKTAVVTIRSIDQIIKEEEEQNKARIMETLANMSDAFFIYQAVKEERILYANPAVMDIFGCESMSELMNLVGYSFRGLVHPEDLDRVQWEIRDQIESSTKNMDYVQYRIIRKDGEIRWVEDWGHLETSKWGEEHQLFYVFIKDITDTITQDQKAKLLDSNRFYGKEKQQSLSGGV